MDYDGHGSHKEYASKGVAGSGLGFGIAGTALGLLPNLLGGGWRGEGECQPLETKEAACLRSELAEAKSHNYTDVTSMNILERLHQFEVATAVANAHTEDKLACLEKQVVEGDKDIYGWVRSNYIPARKAIDKCDVISFKCDCDDVK